MLPYGIVGCVHHAHLFKCIADAGGGTPPLQNVCAYTVRGVRAKPRRGGVTPPVPAYKWDAERRHGGYTSPPAAQEPPLKEKPKSAYMMHFVRTNTVGADVLDSPFVRTKSRMREHMECSPTVLWGAYIMRTFLNASRIRGGGSKPPPYGCVHMFLMHRGCGSLQDAEHLVERIL